MPDDRFPTTLEELRAFVRAEVRKALQEATRSRGWEPYTPPHMETKASAPGKREELPAWTRHEEGAAH